MRRLLAAATGPNGDYGKLNHAYYAAWVATIVVAVFITVFTIIVHLWRIEQRLRADGRVGTGEFVPLLPHSLYFAGRRVAFIMRAL